jgi:translation initiation factor 1 (eIF-1/SUI1)
MAKQSIAFRSPVAYYDNRVASDALAAHIARERDQELTLQAQNLLIERMRRQQGTTATIAATTLLSSDLEELIEELSEAIASGATTVAESLEALKSLQREELASTTAQSSSTAPASTAVAEHSGPQVVQGNELAARHSAHLEAIGWHIHRRSFRPYHSPQRTWSTLERFGGRHDGSTMADIARKRGPGAYEAASGIGHVQVTSAHRTPPNIGGSYAVAPPAGIRRGGGAPSLDGGTASGGSKHYMLPSSIGVQVSSTFRSMPMVRMGAPHDSTRYGCKSSSI